MQLKMAGFALNFGAILLPCRLCSRELLPAAQLWSGLGAFCYFLNSCSKFCLSFLINPLNPYSEYNNQARHNIHKRGLFLRVRNVIIFCTVFFFNSYTIRHRFSELASFIIRCCDIPTFSKQQSPFKAIQLCFQLKNHVIHLFPFPSH